MDTNLIVQYILVGVIILGLIAWTVFRIVRKRRNRPKGVPGCPNCSAGNFCSMRKK